MGDELLTVASFFSGVGLLDLGLEWAGWRTVSLSEYEPYASRVLGLRFPGVPNLGDITRIDPSDIPDATLWAGGFPCQPVSIAGKGRAQDDDRWLWPVWAGLVRVVRPRYLLLENVANLLAVNDGRAFGEVLGDLAALGYDAEWDCIPAAAVGAPHLRDRVWVIGTRVVPGGDDRPDDVHLRPRQPGEAACGAGGVREALAHSDGQRGRRGLAHWEGAEDAWQPPGREGFRWWDVEPDVGRVAHGVPARVDRLRCLGNGVVPQVAEFLGWRLRQLVEGR